MEGHPAGHLQDTFNSSRVVILYNYLFLCLLDEYLKKGHLKETRHLQEIPLLLCMPFRILYKECGLHFDWRVKWTDGGK